MIGKKLILNVLFWVGILLASGTARAQDVGVVSSTRISTGT